MIEDRGPDISGTCFIVLITADFENFIIHFVLDCYLKMKNWMRLIPCLEASTT